MRRAEGRRDHPGTQDRALHRHRAGHRGLLRPALLGAPMPSPYPSADLPPPPPFLLPADLTRCATSRRSLGSRPTASACPRSSPARSGGAGCSAPVPTPPSTSSSWRRTAARRSRLAGYAALRLGPLCKPAGGRVLCASRVRAPCRDSRTGLATAARARARRGGSTGPTARKATASAQSRYSGARVLPVARLAITRARASRAPPRRPCCTRARAAAGFTCRLPCLKTAPHLPPWGI